ncbi:MAG: hypothetical protein K2Q26_07810 [Bdellovibrionales bacterium]|nr:hypothetical protein [Bdellovibrionales bacterium]
MKWILFIMSIVFASTSSARVVCGVDIGDKPIHIMANQCRIYGLRDFKKKYSAHPNYIRECIVDGKKVVVSVLVQYNFAAAFDFTSPATRLCRTPVGPASYEGVEGLFNDEDQDQSLDTTIEI